MDKLIDKNVLLPTDSNPVSALKIFRDDVRLDAEGRIAPAADSETARPAQPLEHLSLQVGDVLTLTVIAVLSDGSCLSLNDADSPWRLRMRSGDYSVLVSGGRPFCLTARQITSGSVRLTVSCPSGRRSWRRREMITAYLDVDVGVGRRFVAFTNGQLSGVPLAFWRYGRRQVSAWGWRRRRSWQYTIDNGHLGMAARQNLSAVAWAESVSLASGWRPQKLTDLACSDKKHAVCGGFNEDGLFSVTCLDKCRRQVSIAVTDDKNEKHVLYLKILPAGSDNMWSGLTESPAFKTRLRVRIENAVRTVCLFLCSLFVLVWLAGCFLAQAESRGILAGLGYTASMLALGLVLVVGVPAVMILLFSLAFALLRKINK